MSKEIKNNKKEQIRLSFKSNKISDVTMPSTEDLIDTLGAENVVSGRIYLIEHADTGKKTKGAPQYPTDGILPTEKTRITDEVMPKLRKLGVNKKNTSVLFNKNTQRTKETAESLIETLNMTKEERDERIQDDIAGLDTTDKTNDNSISRESFATGEAAEFMNELLQKAKGKENINILNIIHSSGVSGMHLTATKDDDSWRYDPNQVNYLDIKEIDVHYGERIKGINYEKKKNILFLNSGNVDGILEILRDDKVLWEHIKDFDDGKIQIFELQNIINYVFKNSELYEKYLGSENEELRVFCLFNLLNKSKYEEAYNALFDDPKPALSQEEKKILHAKLYLPETIRAMKTDIVTKHEYIYKTYMDSKHKLSQEEKKILLTKANISGARTIITAHFVTKKDLRNKEEGELFSSLELDDFYKELQERRKTYEKAVEIQKRSLDESIVQQNDDSILERKIYKIEKIENKAENKTEYKEINIDTQEIMLGLKSGKHYVLPAHVGNGKSIWSSELIKNLTLNSDINIGFFEGKDFNTMESKTVSELFPIGEPRNFKERKIVCIEAIDEINDPEIKKTIKNYMKNQYVGAIVTSRLSEYNDQNNEGWVTLGMKSISKEEFITKKISDPTKRSMVLKKLNESYLSEEIEGNPLLLNFVCILTNEEGKYKDLGIKSLHEIENKADLYENIIKLILFKHQESKDKNKKESKNTTISGYMDKLGELAYNKHNGWSFSEFINKDNLNESIIDDINILFKKDGNDSYDFIHKSFEEYFLARYLTKQTEGDKGIYHIRDVIAGEENRNTWKSFRPTVDFYGEILINQNQTETLQRFLGKEGLLENDDALGYNFYLGLDLLDKLPENDKSKQIFNQYEKKLKEINTKTPNNAYFFIYHFMEKQKIHRRIKKQMDVNTWLSISDSIGGSTLDRREDKITFKILGKFAKIGGKEGMDLIHEIIKKRIAVGKYEEAGSICKEIAQIDDMKIKEFAYGRIRNLFNQGGYRKIRNICKDFIETGDKKIIGIVYEYVNKLFGEGKYEEAGSICKNFTKTDNKKIIKLAYECAKKLFEQGKYLEALNISQRLTETNDKKSIELIYKCVRKMFEKGKHFEVFLFTDITEINEKNIIELIYEGAKKILEESKDIETILFIVEKIIKIDNKKIREILYECATKLFEQGEYQEILSVCQDILKMDDEKSKELTYKCATKLFEQGEYQEVLFVYQDILEMDDEKSKELIYKCVKKIFGKGEHVEMLRLITNSIKIHDGKTKELIYKCAKKEVEHGKYISTKMICEYFIKTDNKKDIDTLYEIAKQMFEQGNYFKAWGIYIELIKLGDKKTREIAYECVKKMFEQGDYRKITFICIEIAQMKDKKTSKLAYNSANILFKQGKYDDALRIYRGFARAGDKKTIERIHECIKKIFEQGDHRKTWVECQGLVKDGNKKIIRIAYECAKKLFEQGEYGKAGSICEDLIKTGNKKIIKLAYESAEKIFEQGEHLTAYLICQRLAEIGYKKALKITAKYIQKLEPNKTLRTYQQTM